ncbi:unnamed protein product, partial [Phaeothamnion confervicola]
MVVRAKRTLNPTAAPRFGMASAHPSPRRSVSEGKITRWEVGQCRDWPPLSAQLPHLAPSRSLSSPRVASRAVATATLSPWHGGGSQGGCVRCQASPPLPSLAALVPRGFSSH